LATLNTGLKVIYKIFTIFQQFFYIFEKSKIVYYFLSKSFNGLYIYSGEKSLFIALYNALKLTNVLLLSVKADPKKLRKLLLVNTLSTDNKPLSLLNICNFSKIHCAVPSSSNILFKYSYTASLKLGDVAITKLGYSFWVLCKNPTKDLTISSGVLILTTSFLIVCNSDIDISVDSMPNAAYIFLTSLSLASAALLSNHLVKTFCFIAKFSAPSDTHHLHVGIIGTAIIESFENLYKFSTTELVISVVLDAIFIKAPNIIVTKIKKIK